MDTSYFRNWKLFIPVVQISFFNFFLFLPFNLTAKISLEYCNLQTQFILLYFKQLAPIPTNILRVRFQGSFVKLPLLRSGAVCIDGSWHLQIFPFTLTLKIGPGNFHIGIGYFFNDGFKMKFFFHTVVKKVFKGFLLPRKMRDICCCFGNHSRSLQAYSYSDFYPIMKKFKPKSAKSVGDVSVIN